MSRYSRSYSYFAPYVPVAERKRAAQEAVKKMAAKGQRLQPVSIEGRSIARTFWGKAWCDNIESYQDYAYRLDRGRTYVRNGSVIDLQIAKGKITALVQGSELYHVNIAIEPLPAAKWAQVKADCAGKIGSLIDLVQGKLSAETIAILCKHGTGVFPAPKEIKMKCDCPDIAGLCKHLAAVLYGVGARLDNQPELFFTLRGVDQGELLSADLVDGLVGAAPAADLGAGDLGSVFGIELDSLDEPAPKKPGRPAKKAAAPKEKVEPKKPGRPAKAVKPAPIPVAVPKKTRRPMKRTAKGKALLAEKAALAAAKKAAAATEPKKRGRPAKTAAAGKS